jgi:hypothetical protein
MTLLRQRMTEDMQIRNLSRHTQSSYLQQVSLLSSQQGPALPTSHPAGRCPHHCPAFGTGELQEDVTIL